MKNSTLLAATALISACISAPAGAQATAKELLTTETPWQTVLDGVMGGRSTGTVLVSTAGVLTFSGGLSLENNGGFAQIRSAVTAGVLGDAKGVALECRGDGRTYNFDVRAANARRMAGAFQSQFATVAGQWIEVRLPFEDFRLYSFGNQVRNAPKLDPQRIESIGVTLSDKNPGDYRLEIRSIRALTDAVPPIAAGAAGPAGQDLIAAAKAAGLTTLLACVTASELSLPSSPVTIFAPTNEAFAAIPKATLDSLLLPESRAELLRILGFHVVRGRMSAIDLLGQRRLTTLAGLPLAISLKEGRITIGDGVAMIGNDIEAGASVIHLIDRVLLPPKSEPAPSTASKSPASAIMSRDAAIAIAGICEAAIERGVVLWNGGNTAGCAAVYEVAVESMVLLGGDSLGKAASARLSEVRQRSERETSWRDRGWVLRGALDDVYVIARGVIELDARRENRSVGTR